MSYKYCRAYKTWKLGGYQWWMVRKTEKSLVKGYCCKKTFVRAHQTSSVSQSPYSWIYAKSVNCSEKVCLLSIMNHQPLNTTVVEKKFLWKSIIVLNLSFVYSTKTHSLFNTTLGMMAHTLPYTTHKKHQYYFPNWRTLSVKGWTMTTDYIEGRSLTC